MDPKQLQSVLANLQSQITAIQQQLDDFNDGSSLPDAMVSAFQTRILADSPLDPSLFDQILSSTPGGVVVPMKGDAVVDIGDDYFLIKYKKL